MADLIDRQAAIDAVDSETVSTNPEHFESSEKFIKFMDDADIASFGEWKWANGFNTALVATRVQLKNLSSAQLSPKTGRWIPQDWNEKNGTSTTLVYCLPKCSICGYSAIQTNYCPNCGARMKEDTDATD